MRKAAFMRRLGIPRQVMVTEEAKVHGGSGQGETANSPVFRSCLVFQMQSHSWLNCSVCSSLSHWASLSPPTVTIDSFARPQAPENCYFKTLHPLLLPPFFTDKDTKAPRSEVICPMSHSH